VLTAVPVQELTAALGEAALVEYIGLDDALHAISVVDGRTRMHYLGPCRPILQLAERLPFALHRLTRHSASATSREAAADLLRTTAGQLDAHVLRRIPGLGDRSLVIIPTSSLQWLPWSVLPSSAGRPVTVSPSATLWQAAQCRDAAPGYVLVAAGPGLRGATGEAEAVASVHGVAPLVGEAATVGAVADRLSGAALAHLATHGRVRADNPLFGSLAFADGPLMIYDLEKLGRPPHTLVVAACDTGRPVVPAGDELLGLTATLLSMGTTQLIASVLPVLDLQTGPLMTALHGAIASGESPAEALAGVQQQTAAEGPSGVATAAGFVCFGAGFARPPVGTAMPAN
jgi:CHAT domain-containing protein